MRILFFAGGSYIGGMEIVNLHLMKELKAQGHECAAVVSGWNDGVYPRQLTDAGIRYECIKLGRVYFSKPLWNFDGLVNFPHAFRQLRALIREFQPDVVVLSSLEFALSALQILPESLSVVIHLHDNPNRHWKSWMGRYVLARSEGVIAVSEFIREQVLASIADANPVNTVLNGIPAVSVASRQPYPKLRVGIVGQLMPRKKHDILVDAVGLLAAKNNLCPEVRIYGANTTPFAQTIAQKIEKAGLAECFRWMGFVASQSELYGDLDVVVAPAVGEPFGMTVLEAGSYGLAIVASKSGGFPETVIDGETGLLVEPDNPTDLAQAIERLMDLDERERLGHNARQHVNENFNVETMGRNFVAALQDLGIGA